MTKKDHRMKLTRELREQLTLDNQLYFDQFVAHMRKGDLSESRTEELILDTAKRLMKLQQRDKSSERLFGESPVEYAEELTSDVTMRRPRTTRDKAIYYVMIPWTALTWVFFIYMVFGFLKPASAGVHEASSIRISTLLFVAVGSVLLMELLTRFLGSERASSSRPSRSMKTDLKSFVVTLGITVIIIAVYLSLSASLPVLKITPMGCLICFIIGLIGQIILMRKPK